MQRWNENTAKMQAKAKAKAQRARTRLNAAPGSFAAQPMWLQVAGMAGAAVVFWGAVGACLLAADVVIGILAYGAWGSWEKGYLPLYAVLVSLLFLDWRWRSWRRSCEEREAQRLADEEHARWWCEHNWRIANRTDDDD